MPKPEHGLPQTPNDFAELLESGPLSGPIDEKAVAAKAHELGIPVPKRVAEADEADAPPRTFEDGTVIDLFFGRPRN